ncbi:MAG: hypothetical protein JW795_07115 [Chitinivibrionales bacterium]|nr:hypothetical protein [Chitinivibrionales bacterium]
MCDALYQYPEAAKPGTTGRRSEKAGGKRMARIRLKQRELERCEARLRREILDDRDIYHVGASLKDLGKKWFAFSKFETGAVEMLKKLKGKNHE